MTNKKEPDYPDLMKGVKGSLELMLCEKKPYFYTFKGSLKETDYLVLPGVFSPKYSVGTEFFAREVPNVLGAYDKKILEIGTGTGIVACEIFCVKGSFTRMDLKVVATDISFDAVRNAKINALIHHPQIDVRYGDVYSPIFPYERFDTIFWNVPFGDWEDESVQMHEAVWDPGQKGLEKFIKGARQHLTGRGIGLLIGYSPDLGKPSLLKELLRANDFTEPNLVAEMTNECEPFPKPIRLHLYQTRPRKNDNQL